MGKEQKKIIDKTGECVDSCPDEYKYFVNYVCYEECPRDIDILQCREGSHVDCEIRDYFLDNCDLNFYNDTSKIWFIEDISQAKIKNKLYDLIIEKKKEKKSLILKLDNITTIQIYSISNKEIVSDLTYIDFSELINALMKKDNNRYNTEDFIVFKIEYNYSYFKIPIIEYRFYYGTGKNNVKLNLIKDPIKLYYLYTKNY